MVLQLPDLGIHGNLAYFAVKLGALLAYEVLEPINFILYIFCAFLKVVLLLLDQIFEFADFAEDVVLPSDHHLDSSFLLVLHLQGVCVVDLGTHIVNVFRPVVQNILEAVAKHALYKTLHKIKVAIEGKEDVQLRLDVPRLLLHLQIVEHYANDRNQQIQVDRVHENCEENEEVSLQSSLASVVGICTED